MIGRIMGINSDYVFVALIAVVLVIIVYVIRQVAKQNSRDDRIVELLESIDRKLDDDR